MKMKNMFMFLAVIALIFSAGAAQADVNYSPFLLSGYDAAGDPIADGTYTLVIDLDNDGWDGVPYVSQPVDTPNDFGWLWDEQDYMLDMGQITNGNAYPSETIDIASIDGYDDGTDEYFLMWFDTPYDVDSTGPAAGIDYGAELLGQVGKDGETLSPIAEGGAAAFQTLGTQVIPEPVSTILMLLGGGTIAFRRRFKA
jgi:hypothetical protein